MVAKALSLGGIIDRNKALGSIATVLLSTIFSLFASYKLFEWRLSALEIATNHSQEFQTEAGKNIVLLVEQLSTANRILIKLDSKMEARDIVMEENKERLRSLESKVDMLEAELSHLKEGIRR